MKMYIQRHRPPFGRAIHMRINALQWLIDVYSIGILIEDAPNERGADALLREEKNHLGFVRNERTHDDGRASGRVRVVAGYVYLSKGERKKCFELRCEVHGIFEQYCVIIYMYSTLRT